MCILMTASSKPGVEKIIDDVLLTLSIYHLVVAIHGRYGGPQLYTNSLSGWWPQ